MIVQATTVVSRIIGRFPLIAPAAVTAAALLISGSAHADKRVALVVGNAAYVNVPRLVNPANDARQVADTRWGQ